MCDSALAKESRDHLVGLYRQHIGDQVRPEDLFHRTDLAIVGPDTNGEPVWLRWPVRHTYDELNKWTTTDGIVHLTHPANTLGAQVALVGAASDFPSSATPGLDTRRGNPGAKISLLETQGDHVMSRSSDLLIGYGIDEAVRGGRRVTLKDPVGTYIGTIELDGLEGPSGEWIGRDALKIVRGRDDAFKPTILRFEIELSSDLPFRLGECKIDGELLEHGGQIARLTNLHLYATEWGGAQKTEADRDNAVKQSLANVEELLMCDWADRGEAGSDKSSPARLLDSPYVGPVVREASVSPSLETTTASRALDNRSTLKPGAHLSLSRVPLSGG